MTYTLTLTQEQLNVIAAGLQEMPFKHAAPLVAEINKQISEQAKRGPVAVNDAAE
jgi:hypothetical protein